LKVVLRLFLGTWHFFPTSVSDMTTIKLVQYADQAQDLHFVLYEDNSHVYTTLDNPDDEHVQRIQRWVAEGNLIDEFVPLISGGVIPLASIMWFCASTAPDGYLLCDGAEVSRARYANLFREIGETYGVGNGSTTFNLPNLVGRFCRGWGPVSPLDPAREFGSYQEDNVKTHIHGLQPDSHFHTFKDPGHDHELVDPGHIHPIQDPGHQHPVTDPGHRHNDTTMSHMGYVGNFLPGFATQALGATPPYSGQEGGSFSLETVSNLAEFVIENAPANLQLANALSNILDERAVTNITVDIHGVNIPYTEFGGDYETRPDNIALLPVIRY
jgi:microcystin-dependent protein